MRGMVFKQFSLGQGIQVRNVRFRILFTFQESG